MKVFIVLSVLALMAFVKSHPTLDILNGGSESLESADADFGVDSPVDSNKDNVQLIRRIRGYGGGCCRGGGGYGRPGGFGGGGFNGGYGRPGGFGGGGFNGGYGRPGGFGGGGGGGGAYATSQSSASAGSYGFGK